MVLGVSIAFAFLSLSLLITTWMKMEGGASVENDPLSSTFFFPTLSFIFLQTLKFLRLNRTFRRSFYERWILKLYVLINNWHVSCEITQTLFCLGNTTWEGRCFLHMFSYITCLKISNDLHLTLKKSKILLHSVHIPTFFFFGGGYHHQLNLRVISYTFISPYGFEIHL
jgi:hypothetical protein